MLSTSSRPLLREQVAGDCDKLILINQPSSGSTAHVQCAEANAGRSRPFYFAENARAHYSSTWWKAAILLLVRWCPVA